MSRRKYRIQLKDATVVDPHVLFLMSFQEGSGYSLPSNYPIKSLSVQMEVTDVNQNEDFCKTIDFDPPSGNAIEVDSITFYEAFSEQDPSAGTEYQISMTWSARDTSNNAVDLYFDPNSYPNLVGLFLAYQSGSVNPTQAPYSSNQLTGTSSATCGETVKDSAVKASKFATFLSMIGAAFSHLFSG